MIWKQEEGTEVAAGGSSWSSDTASAAASEGGGAGPEVLGSSGTRGAAEPSLQTPRPSESQVVLQVLWHFEGRQSHRLLPQPPQFQLKELGLSRLKPCHQAHEVRKL